MCVHGKMIQCARAWGGDSVCVCVHGEMSHSVYMADVSDDDLMCLLPCSDLTIISGDSRGKTSFWNGKQGTRITVGGTAACHNTQFQE